MTPLTGEQTGPPERPWQLTVAVLLLAGWWVGTYGYLLLSYGRSEQASEDLSPLWGISLLTVATFLLLLRAWQGGSVSYGLVTSYAILIGIALEIAGVVLAVGWLLDRSRPWWYATTPMLLAGIPLYAGRLLLSRPVRTYARRDPAGSVHGDGGASDPGDLA